MKHIYKHKILILDFGSQYTQLIARCIREFGVYCEIYSHDVRLQAVKNFCPSGIILSGGPDSVNYSSAVKFPDDIFNLNIPILGICYGMQAMVYSLGGKISPSQKCEFGCTEITVTTPHILYTGTDKKQEVWMSHVDEVVQIGSDFQTIASSKNTPIAAIAHKKKPFFGVQYHPEVTHTKEGRQFLRNFVFKICHCSASWSATNIIEVTLNDVRKKVKDEMVILALSGGVDSSVVAALLQKAIGPQLVCIFVDTGLLRLHEGDEVMEMFAKNMNIKVIRVNEEQLFLNRLKNVSDPENKRKIIGNLFIDVFNREASKITNAKWLAQGTIYSDVIESAGNVSGAAHVIKSHHNVGGLPQDMKLQLLEPLRTLFKDEVKKIGVELGLPFSVIYRHPFPGPGLAIRILGEIKKEYISIIRLVNFIYTEELKEHGLYEKVSQAFAVFLPIKSVGVMGDQRKHDYVIALRAVETVDFMTARWAHLPYNFIDRVSNRIVNEVKGVSRVVYDITDKPPATIEWE